MNKFLLFLVLTITPVLAGCYTQFASTQSVRSEQTSEALESDLLQEAQDVTINNYYDSYYSRFMRPTIYGFGSVWDWGNPFWDYPLWYQPVWGAPVVVAPYIWGAPFPYHYWNRWNIGFANYAHSGGYVSSSPNGTRRVGIGRMRASAFNTLAPISNTSRLTQTPNNDAKSILTPPTVSRRERSGNPQSVSKNIKEAKSVAPARRRQTGLSRPAPSYKPSSPSNSPSSNASRNNDKSAPSSNGRRQR